MKETLTYKNRTSNPEHLDENELAQYAEYLRHETGPVPDRLIDHVAACSYCRAELMAITDMLDTLPDLAEEPAMPVEAYPSPIVRRVPLSGFKLLRTAAAVAAVVLIAWGIKQLVPNRIINQPVATNLKRDTTLTKDTLTPNPLTPNPLTSNPLTSNPLTSNLPASNPASKTVVLPDTVRYASAFVPNSTYESLVNAKYRSGNDPKVAGPDPGKVFNQGDTLKLSWSADPGDEYVLVIVDNKANPIKEIAVGRVTLLVWKIDLKPGLYYWKFLGKEEMWKVGKIKVVGSQ